MEPAEPMEPLSTWATDMRHKVGRARWRLNRIGDDPYSPFCSLPILWEGERCPTCTRAIPLGSEGAWDLDYETVFCMKCARKIVDPCGV